jgi:hypothetical protein
MTANEIMRYVRKWHEQIGDMPSKQVGPEVCQIHREMERVILEHGNSYAISRNRQQKPDSQSQPAEVRLQISNRKGHLYVA